jgi:hypothetical protein
MTQKTNMQNVFFSGISFLVYGASSNVTRTLADMPVFLHT